MSDVECSRSSWWGKSARWRRRGCGAQQQSPKTTEVTSLPTLFALPSNSKMQRSSSATIICPPLHWLSWRRGLRWARRFGAAAGLWACGSRMGHEMQQEKVRKHTPLKRGLLLNSGSLLQNSGSLLKRFCRCCWGGGVGRKDGGGLLLAGGEGCCWLGGDAAFAGAPLHTLSLAAASIKLCKHPASPQTAAAVCSDS